ICQLTMSERIIHLLGKRIILVPVQNGDIKEIIQSQITFFDLQSEKCKQFGFTMSLKNGKKLSFLGDEPYQPSSEIYVKESDWLLSEAFCLDAHRSRYHPEKIQHSTVKEACEIAQYLKAKNLVLWHTEDDHLSERRELYTAEGQKYFQGQIFVPDDLEIIEL
ncbi:MAG: MBL fold metallo-hydrolase, partial [Peptococcales bacterium]